MIKEDEELLRVEIRNRFYYIRYPDPLPPNLWLDRNGKLHYMSDMRLDHLKNSIGLVKRDLLYLADSHRPKDVISVLMPLAQDIMRELEEEFERQANF